MAEFNLRELEGMEDALSIIDDINAVDDDSFNETTVIFLKQQLNDIFNAQMRRALINAQMQTLAERKITDEDMENFIIAFWDMCRKELEDKNITNEYKIETIKYAYEKILEIFRDAYLKSKGIEGIIHFQKMVDSATIPTYAHEGDACADISSAYDYDVPPHALGFMVDTGLRAAIPEGYEIQVRPRSGMSCKTPIRIANAPGTIDSSYLGVWNVIVDNLSDEPYHISAGDRIAQIAFKPTFNFVVDEVVDVENIKQTARGANGFGSSGK